jgi:hypothetical protein
MGSEDMLPNTLITFGPEPYIHPNASSRIKQAQNPKTPRIRQQLIPKKVILSLTRLVYKYFSLSKSFWCCGHFVTLVGLNVLFSVTYAHDVGARGKCFMIKEEDFQTFIIRRLSQKDIQKKIKADFQLQLTRALVSHTALRRATKARVYMIDPTVQTAQKGSINPFDYVTYDKALIFLNADDGKQKDWLNEFLKKDLTQPIKIILVGGHALTLQRHLNRQVFVDQDNTLTDYFQLKHLPAVVIEDKHIKKWRVSEVLISKIDQGNGDSV